MHEWSLSDRRRHQELIEQCREERKRTRKLVERSRELSAGYRTAPQKDSKDGGAPTRPTSR